MLDLIIIGGGPAGLSAAIYALRAGKKVLILEKGSIGGKITSSPLIENYPGFSKISGEEYAEKLYQQVLDFGGILEIEEVRRIVPGKIKKVITDCGEYEAKALILATGSTYRKLGLKKEDVLLGNGLSYCAICDGAFYKGEIVAVVGGGNSAVTSAISLASFCQKVHLIVRKDNLRAEPILVSALKKYSNIEIHFHTVIKELVGEEELSAIVIHDKEEKLLETKGLFISIGQDPETDWLTDITLTKDFYISAQEDCKTNQAGIFVAGDCREKEFRQLTTAVSDGTVAALQAISYLKER